MIDIVIPVHEKDKNIALLCVDHIRRFCKDVKKIYIISKKKYIPDTEWIDEGLFPCSIADVRELIKHKKQAAWYWQQIIQFYLWDVKKLSNYIVFINSDVILMRPIEFLRDGKAVHNYNYNKHEPYMRFNKKMLGKLTDRNKYGVVHYMVYSKKIMNEIVKKVELKHNMVFWKAFCNCITQEHVNGASEFDMYFAYILTKHVDDIILKKLKYDDQGDVWNIDRYIKAGYDYIAFHKYLREAAGGN